MSVHIHMLNTDYRQPVCNSENEKNKSRKGKLMLYLQTDKWMLLGFVGARRITSQTPIRHEGLFCATLMEVACLYCRRGKIDAVLWHLYNWYCGIFLIQFCQLASPETAAMPQSYWVHRSVDINNRCPINNLGLGQSQLHWDASGCKYSIEFSIPFTSWLG